MEINSGIFSLSCRCFFFAEQQHTVNVAGNREILDKLLKFFALNRNKK